jgi:hypothetical protein
MIQDYLTDKKSWFGLALAAVCLTYFFFQLFYNQYAQWSVDDFWFAHGIYEFKNSLPYRDFSPYKTVLGYYFLLPTMLLGHDALTPLLYTKQFIALLNTILFAFATVRLSKFFPKFSVLAALILLISTDFVLSYSTNIRVDLLGYWLCLFSVLYLLENQFLKAGLTLGVGFLVSQKVLWYITASDIALGIYWLSAARHRTFFWGTALFNLAIFIPLIIYTAFWSGIADLHTVLHNLFYEAYIMFQLDSYDSTRYFFWSYTLSRNAFIFLIWPLSFMMLFVKTNEALWNKRLFIIVYTAVIMGSLISYKQVFPYYMLTTLPAFFLLYTAFFEWMSNLLKDSHPPVNKTNLWIFIFCYLILFTYIYFTFLLSSYYLLIVVLPLLLGLKMTSTTHSTLRIATPAFIGIITIFMGVACPIIILLHNIQMISRGYQKSMVQLTEILLKNGGDYLAGIELIYNKNQPIPGLRHLDVPALSYLYQPTKKLASAMLASLYHTPNITRSKAIDYLKTSSVKFYVNNYRINALPPDIKYFLNANYQHFWGSIYLYAPLIEYGDQPIHLKFSGKYRVNSITPIQIDHHAIPPNAMIILTEGMHVSHAIQNYRLVLQEDHLTKYLNPRYKTDEWLRVI